MEVGVEVVEREYGERGKQGWKIGGKLRMEMELEGD